MIKEGDINKGDPSPFVNSAIRVAPIPYHYLPILSSKTELRKDLIESLTPFDTNAILRTYQIYIGAPYCYYTIQPNDSDNFLSIRCAKRGDSQYQWHLKNKLYPMFRGKQLPLLNISNPHKTYFWKVFLISLTFNPSIPNELAWKNLTYYETKFQDNLRKAYPKIQYQKVRHIQDERGCPQTHYILVFPHAMRCFSRNGILRMQQKRYIEHWWPYGFSDIEGITSHKGLTYASSYLLSGSASETTYAFLWFYSKRGYSFTKHFESALDLITVKDNLEWNAVDTQTLLEMSKDFEYFGVFLEDEIDPGGHHVGAWVIWTDVLPERLRSSALFDINKVLRSSSRERREVDIEIELEKWDDEGFFAFMFNFLGYLDWDVLCYLAEVWGIPYAKNVYLGR